MANYEATKYDFNGANLTGIEGIPTGTITSWSESTAPTGFLECAGAAVSRSTYAALFAVIGTTYGAGNGSTTFNVPDLTDKVVCGKSNNKNFASTGGANTVTPTGNVAGSTANATLSTAQLASHAHPGGATVVGSQYGPYFPRLGSANTGNAGSGQGHSHNLSANFTGSPNSVLQPFLTVIYIIKT
jgi:microcystin-dependent protein